MPNDQASLLVIADTHINSTVAVCPPRVNLDDGGTYHASRTQVWLWRCLEEVAAEFAKMPGRKVVCFNGDLGELDTKRRSIQLVTANKATIQRMVFDTIEPLVDLADSVYVVRGTQAHTGKSAWLEEAIAQDLTNAVPFTWSDEVDQKTGEKKKAVASWWLFRGELAGVPLDIGHHARMGGLPWTKFNSVNQLAARALWYYRVMLKTRPASLVIRSHQHRKADSGDNYETRAMITPCFTTPTENYYRIGAEFELADIGAYAYICNDGECEIQKFLFEPREARRVWSTKM